MSDARWGRENRGAVQLCELRASGASGSSIAGDPQDRQRGALTALSPEFEKLYAKSGRPSIPPEKLPPTVFSGASAVVVIPDGMFYTYRRDVVALDNAARLPAIYPEWEYADDGGSMAYGANVPDNFRRAASYVDRILKGASPADLPIQEPVRFDFVINLKTANALGLTIPPLILARADEVIE